MARFDELKLKYQSVLNLIQHAGPFYGSLISQPRKIQFENNRPKEGLPDERCPSY